MPSTLNFPIANNRMKNSLMLPLAPQCENQKFLEATCLRERYKVNFLPPLATASWARFNQVVLGFFLNCLSK